jgi:NAD(P)-dependent dehydrogenase (short-subunit alcohol dehydrogenase family)
VNLTGFFLCAHHAVRLMKTQDPRGRRIINNGSISVRTSRPPSVGYTATKHAITGLIKSISLDCRRRADPSGADIRQLACRRHGAVHGLAWTPTSSS